MLVVVGVLVFEVVVDVLVVEEVCYALSVVF